MKGQRLLSLLALILLLGASMAHTQSGGGYDLAWNSLDGGGITYSSGGTYAPGATIEQLVRD